MTFHVFIFFLLFLLLLTLAWLGRLYRLHHGLSHRGACIVHPVVHRLLKPRTPVLATCGIRRPELGCENTSFCLLFLADSPEEEYNLKH